MRTTSALACVLAATALTGLPAPAAAQMMEPITLVGYFERTGQDHPDVSYQIQLSTDGRTHRSFGLSRVQSQIGVAGSDVFKRSMQPVVNVRGQNAMIAKLDAATPVQRVKIIGMLQASGMSIILNGVEVAEPPPTEGIGQMPGEAPANTSTSKE